MNIGLIGAGRAGQALATALEQSGVAVVAVAGGKSDAARAFAVRRGTRFCTENSEVARAAEVVLLAVPDREIASVAEELAAGDLPSPLVVLHICGSQTADSLAPLRQKGIATGSMHPLQSFTEDVAEGAAALRTAYFAVDGDAQAVAQATALIGRLGGRMIAVKPGQRALYHAAACTASNYLVSLLHSAARMLQPCGLSEPEALAALRPLVGATLDNIFRQGTLPALSGPIQRGDSTTLRRQLGQMEAFSPAESPLYAALGEYTVAMLAAAGRLDGEQVKNLLGTFQEYKENHESVEMTGNVCGQCTKNKDKHRS